LTARAGLEVSIGVEKLGPMVLTEVHCAGELGRGDVAVLIFRPASAELSG
jgi:hypothetical protein